MCNAAAPSARRTQGTATGRQLASLTENGTTWSYTYDNDGMRTGRTNGTTAYSYVYNGSQLVQMTVGSDTLRFTYDAAGTPLTVTYNGTTYYYITNLQGDVVAIVNASGVKQVEYTYDAWGRLLDVEGTLELTLGTRNPLRYRGYVYDHETALYYLQTRYYDPVMGRFINEDVYTATGQGFVGNNMFAYCLNNPVKYIDIDGMDAGLLSAWAGSMWWICGVDTVLPVGDIIYVGGIVILAIIAIATIEENTSEFTFDSPATYASPPPPNNNDDDDEDDYYGNDDNFGGRQKIGKSKGGTPGNNQTQNSQFRHATRGLSKGKQRRIHDLITGRDLDYHEVSDFADTFR